MSSQLVQLRRLATLRVEPSPEIRPTVVLETVGSGTGRLVDEPVESGPDGNLAFEAGDVLFGKLRPYLAKSLVVDRPLHGSSEFLCMTPSPRLNSRFLGYVVLSQPFLEHAESSSYGLKMPRTSWNEVGNFRVPLPPVEEQRRIADFLDDHVTLIDGLKSARAQQTALVKEQSLAELDRLLGGTAVRPLQTFTDPGRPIQYGIVLPGPDFPGGIPIIKGGDVAAGRMSLDLLNRTDPEIEARYPRSRLIPGDLVISIRGSSGEVAVVPDELDGANLTQDAARIAALEADPRWLRWVLQTPAVQGAIQQRVTGAMVTGINIESLRHLRLPDPPRAEQKHLGLAAESLMQQATSHIEILKASVALLEERKRALITAAVTGELDVTTAKPIGVGKWVPNVGANVEAPMAAQASGIGGIG